MDLKKVLTPEGRKLVNNVAHSVREIAEEKYPGDFQIIKEVIIWQEELQCKEEAFNQGNKSK